MLPLRCAVQKYDWGKIGNDSLVTKFVEEKTVDKNTHYAELWMGTHPNGECKVVVQGEEILLREYLKKESQKKIGELPFLFKILSIREPLSIQLHPTKEIGQELFEKDPLHYKDGNHKPECAIALTHFEAMCGFLPFSSIDHHIQSNEILKNLLLSGIREEEEAQRTFLTLTTKNDLKRIFQKLLETDSSLIERSLEKTFQLIQMKKKKNKKEEEEELSREERLFLRLFEKYPKDRCCYCAWFFNYFELSPGESLFIRPCEPHSYVCGDIIECMANSDNVIRAGLTPKFIDQQTLLSITNFEDKTPEENVCIPQKIKEFPGKVYKNDEFKEFKVISIQGGGGTTGAGNEKEEQNYNNKILNLTTHSVLLVVKGNATIHSKKKKIKEGEVFFLMDENKLQFNDCSKDFLAFIATSNI